MKHRPSLCPPGGFVTFRSHGERSVGKKVSESRPTPYFSATIGSTRIARRAREIAGGNGYQHKQSHRPPQKPAGRLRSPQKADPLITRVKLSAPSQTTGNTDQRQHHALLPHQREDVGALRAQRQANSNIRSSTASPEKPSRTYTPIAARIIAKTPKAPSMVMANRWRATES